VARAERRKIPFIVDGWVCGKSILLFGYQRVGIKILNIERVCVKRGLC
jgi:hypothetical protein